MRLSSLSVSGRLDLDARHLKLKKFDIDFGAHKLLTYGEFKQGKAGELGDSRGFAGNLRVRWTLTIFWTSGPTTLPPELVAGLKGP